MSRPRSSPAASKRKKGKPDRFEALVDSFVATSKPAPEPILAEVHAAIDNLGTLFRIDKSLADALKDELGIRLLAAESPALFVYCPRRQPQRLILLNYLKRDGLCRVDPAAMHEECAHALRSMFHPIENVMIQEFFGALGPILALDKRLVSSGPMLDVANTIYEMRHGGGNFVDIPDALANMLRKSLPPNILAKTDAGGGNEAVADGFLENAFTHIGPMLAAESMADTGYLAELMNRYTLLSMPPKEMAAILNEYGQKCALDPAWKEKFKDFRKVFGYYLKPGKAPIEAPP